MKTTKTIKTNYTTIAKGKQMPIAYTTNGIIKTVFRTVKEDEKGFYVSINKEKQYIAKSEKPYKGVTTIILEGINAITKQAKKAPKKATNKPKQAKKATNKPSQAKTKKAPKTTIEVSDNVPFYTPIHKTDLITEEMKEHYIAFLNRTNREGNKVYNDKQKEWLGYYASKAKNNNNLMSRLIEYAGIKENGEQSKRNNPFYAMSAKMAYQTSNMLEVTDIFNDLITSVLIDEKITFIENDFSIYTYAFYKIRDNARTDINRLNGTFDKVKFEVTDMYELFKLENGQVNENTKEVVTYTRIEKQKTRLKKSNRYKTIKEVDEKTGEILDSYREYTKLDNDLIIKNGYDKVLEDMVIESILNEKELKIFNLMLQDYTKKEIDKLTGQRNDRTYNAIKDKLRKYKGIA